MTISLLAGKVVLITGASRGIGKTAARLFAEEGASVVLPALQRLEPARQDVRTTRGGRGGGLAVQRQGFDGERGDHARGRGSGRVALCAVTDRADVPDWVLDEVRAVCAALPEATEQAAWVGVRWSIRNRSFVHVFTAYPGETGGV